MLSPEQGQVLVRLARQTIEEHLELAASDPLTARELDDPALQERRGVFVTLHQREALRGCIGSLQAMESLLDGVRRHALNAAFHDHRFTPVSAPEVAALQLSVSVLSKPLPLTYSGPEELLRKLRPEIDGVILKAPSGAGATFLPQVWKQLPDPAAFLGHLCCKAGLGEHYWRTSPLEIETYHVHYFEEAR
ncbi:AmmeMemoRadiSam system protein A [Desulfogranum mediterraneum]|uniref:AmmeMemoRadiSam system protein A n=1 Tax=Desulfogranum mediterraneum TaxID=160661 RepID=UPI00041E72A8|nr:AmmeMemoRadiSam system protein A [Desulfogranum mediterraneum]